MKLLYSSRCLALLVLSFAFGASANATLVTFDDLGTDPSAIPSGYAGLKWDRFESVSDTYISSNYGTNGYINGTVSPLNVAFAGFDNPASFSIATGSFDFNSTYLTASWNNGLNIEVDGFKSGVQLYAQTVTVNSFSPTFFAINYLGVDTVTFSSSGGVSAGYSGDPSGGLQFAMDNLTINGVSPVPEPTTALFGFALAGVVAMRRLRTVVA